MIVHRLKVVLTVLAEKSKNISKSCIIHAVPESLFQLPQEVFFKGIDIDSLKEGISNLINSKNELERSQEGEYVSIIFKVLLVIFSNTTQLERQYHLKDLLEHFHDAMTENQLKTADSSLVLSTEEYYRLIRQCLPLVKLEIVQRQLKKYNPTENEDASPLRIAIEELYECVCYPRILREECYEIVTKKLGSRDFELQQFEFRDMDERGGSLGMYGKLKILVKQQGESQELRFFAKFLLGTEEVLRSVSEKGFRKEAFLYTTFVPLLKQMGMESLVGFLPECYLVRPDEILLLEDVSVQKYSALDAIDTFDLDHILKTVKELAKLHAASLVFEEKLSESLGKPARIDQYYGEYLIDLFHIPGNDFTVHSPIFIEYFLKRFPAQIPKNLTVETIIKKVKEHTSKWFQGTNESDEVRKVLCHGDTWCNNILFQHNGEKNPDSCYLLDYQLIRYSPPTLEILYFLYTSTSRATRSEHMATIMKAYYAELKTHLNEYGIDIEKIYSPEAFLECSKSMKLAAITHSLVYLQYMLIPKEKLEELKRDAELIKKFYSGDRSSVHDKIWDYLPFRTRLTETIEEVCEICEEI